MPSVKLQTQLSGKLKKIKKLPEMHIVIKSVVCETFDFHILKGGCSLSKWQCNAITPFLLINSKRKG
jgi:hypothetical protein